MAIAYSKLELEYSAAVFAICSLHFALLIDWLTRFFPVDFHFVKVSTSHTWTAEGDHKVRRGSVSKTVDRRWIELLGTSSYLGRRSEEWSDQGLNDRNTIIANARWLSSDR